MSTTPPSPSPAPAPAPSQNSLVKTLDAVLHDAEVALGALVTIGEGVLVTLPAGPLHDAGAIALPIIAAIALGLRRIGA